LFYGLYDERDRALAYVNAGHHPPVLAHASGRIDRLHDGGPVLGLFEDADFSVGCASLQLALASSCTPMA
jgi:phosphoserine phosphatase RsbU/P